MDSNIFPNNIILYFDPQIDNKNDLESIVFDCYQKNQDFFNKKDIKIEITFLYQRKDMDEICGYETPAWHVGYTNKNKIFIFSPSIFQNVSDHPQSDFPYVLAHEIAHIFTNEILKFFYPKWLHEGLAGYVAEQYKIRPVGKINKFFDLHDKNGWNKFNNYPQAFSFTKYLIDKFGKDKMIEFLKNLRLNLKDNHSYNEFVKLFNSFLKSDFDKEVSTWSKLI